MCKIEELKQEGLNIISTAKEEVRDLTPDEENRLDNIKSEIEELRKSETVQQENNEIRNISKIMNTEFRLVKAIRDIANNRSLDSVAGAVSAKGADEMRSCGLSFGGQIQLPSETRAAITVTSEGEDVVATDVYDIMKPLRAKNVLAKAGAKFLTSLVGDVQIPVMSKANVGWAGEIEEAADGAATFTHVKLAPHRLTAYIDLSKQFLAQDSIDAENVIREDLINAINSKLEETILGKDKNKPNSPDGIFGVLPAITTATADYKSLCEKEATVEDANILGTPCYVMSNKAKAVFRGMAKSSKSTELTYEGGMIDGTPVYATSNVAEKNYVYGDFSNLAIGQWGGIDLTVDPYSKAASGVVRVVVNAFFDAKVLRPEAFVAGKV